MMTSWDSLIAPAIHRVLASTGLPVAHQAIVVSPWQAAYQVMPKSNREWRDRAAKRSGSTLLDPDPYEGRIGVLDVCDPGLQTLPLQLWLMLAQAMGSHESPETMLASVRTHLAQAVIRDDRGASPASLGSEEADLESRVYGLIIRGLLALSCIHHDAALKAAWKTSTGTP